MLSTVLIVVLSYLLGSIPASVWVGKGLYGVDVREHGSGNAGATNVFRVLGWKAGVLTTLIDVGKGFFASAAVAGIRIDAVPSFGEWDASVVLQLVAGLSAVVGHMFPVWARFKGGKGVNTAAGFLLAVTPLSLLITFGVFVFVLAASRYVSLASMIAAVSFPTTVAVRRFVFGQDLDPSILVLGAILAAGIVYMHRANIGRLLAGNENRVRSFKPGKGRLREEQAEANTQTSSTESNQEAS
ncbi:MAG: glycerol-3-phosphate 1-O-acyltransferase PlsY [Bacteroidota bacterium]